MTPCPVMVQMVEEGSSLLRRMEICVAEAEKRSGKNAVNMQETFSVYLIETRWEQHWPESSERKCCGQRCYFSDVFNVSLLPLVLALCCMKSLLSFVTIQNHLTKLSCGLRPMDAVAEGRNPAPDSLWRRYSEFELLRNYLIVTYPYTVVPPLPEKRVSSVWLSFALHTLALYPTTHI